MPQKTKLTIKIKPNVYRQEIILYQSEKPEIEPYCASLYVAMRTGTSEYFEKKKVFIYLF